MDFEYIWLFDVHHLEKPILMLAIMDFFSLLSHKAGSIFLSFILVVFWFHFIDFTEVILISM